MLKADAGSYKERQGEVMMNDLEMLTLSRRDLRNVILGSVKDAVRMTQRLGRVLDYEIIEIVQSAIESVPSTAKIKS
jgi:hypothetical protein